MFVNCFSTVIAAMYNPVIFDKGCFDDSSASLHTLPTAMPY